MTITTGKTRVESALLHVLEQTESLYYAVATTPDPDRSTIVAWISRIMAIGERRQSAVEALAALFAEKETKP